jgi:hypothetical protein
MVWGKWYVVDVSFRATNPIHRAIATDFREGKFVVLIGDYEDRIETANIKNLSYFKVICEIGEMKKKPQFCLPKDAQP